MTRILIILTILSIIIFFSCNSKKERNSLTKEQIHKIEKIQFTLAEVHPVSLEETINIFKSDQNPNGEINIWLQMANTYEWYLKIKGNLDLKTKEEVFKLILSRSMMTEEKAIIDSELKILTQKDAKEILSHYTLPPE